MKFLKFLKYLIWQPFKDLISATSNSTFSRNLLFLLALTSLILKLAGNESFFSETLFAFICFLGALAFHIKREWTKWVNGESIHQERLSKNIPTKGDIKNMKNEMQETN